MSIAGQTLGPYRLVRRLAVGGMGEVWEAVRVDGSAGSVALKRLLTGTDEPSLLRKFLHEARVGVQLHHPNVVRTLDVGVSDGGVYLVMELLDGATLSQLLKSTGPLPVGLAVNLVLQLLAGLGHAHQAAGADGKPLRVVHRDIKPSNAHVGRDGRLKLIDFGIALTASDERTLTKTGHFHGTLAYSSPEHVRNEPLDARSDLFAVGLVLHQMLTGRRVFERRSEAAVVSAVLWDEIPSVRATRPDVPEGLDEAVRWALERERDRRPSSAEQLADAIKGSGAPRVADEEVADWVNARASAPVPAPGQASAVGDTVSLAAPQRPLAPAATKRPRRPFFMAAVVAAGLASALVFWARTDGPPPTGAPTPSPTPAEPPQALPAAVPSEPPPQAPRPEVPPAPSAAPRPPARKPSPRAPQPAARPGFLTVDARPDWATIFVNGQELGPTPLFRKQLAPGRYSLEAVRPDGRRQNRSVRIASDSEERVLIRW